MKETVIQFGEGNFLRGFVDYFIDKMNKQGLYNGKVVAVQPIPRGLSDLINAQKGRYNLFLRGIDKGKEICEMTEIESISRCINPYADFDSYIALAHDPDMRFIISNTTEAGIVFDGSNSFDDKPASSFPGKLTQLLFERYKCGLDGFVVFACELIDNNGGELKKCVLKYARQWRLGEAFAKWIDEENCFCSTLVDRIVTGYPKGEAEQLWCRLGWTDKLLDTAEIFHLWVIEGDFESEFPLKRAGVNVIWTDDAAQYKKRKVRVLNGAHTAMVFPALLCGIKTVKDALKDEQIGAYLRKCLFDYILPVLGESEENKDFANAVLERFANPFIEHQLKSIALNSVSKFAVRVLPTVLDWKNAYGEYPRVFVLSMAALIEYYKSFEPEDDEKSVAFIKESTVEKTVSNSALWGADISDMSGSVITAYEIIKSKGIREAVKWAMS